MLLLELFHSAERINCDSFVCMVVRDEGGGGGGEGGVWW